MCNLKPFLRARQRDPSRRKHLYAIINCGSLRSLELIGIDDAIVYCQPYKSIGAAVSDVTREESAQDLAAIASHEKVIENLMEQFSVLPARVGTTLPGNEQLDELLTQNYPSFCRDLQRLESKVQFDLKVLWPPGQIRVAIELEYPSLAGFVRLENIGSPGERYALYKQRERATTRILRRKAAERADVIQRSLLSICSESCCEVMSSEEIMLSGAYLIERSRCDEFCGTVEALQAGSTELSFDLTGPWPPYSFMNIDERILKCEVV